MAQRSDFTSHKRIHVVLIPGFGGFDALGQVEYYSGVTSLFKSWIERHEARAVLHYFDNLPTAAVHTRAARLRAYLAKRMVRGEILEGDKIVLVGHSTGGLDIRQLVRDLHDLPDDPVFADGDAYVARKEIRNRIEAAVFLSVPHWGTNIADWVHSHPGWRRAVIAQLRAAVAGSQLYLLDNVEAQVAGGIAYFTDADLLLAAKDALTEANANYGPPGPSRTADAQEAASQLTLFFAHMCTDFSAIDDLRTQPYDDPAMRTPAHLDEGERAEELETWQDPPIRTLTFATLGGRPFRFRPGVPAPVWELTSPSTYPEIAKDPKLSEGSDVAYRLCYRACAGGPFRMPPNAGTAKLPPGFSRLEVWDNDGVVNTASMLWPPGGTVELVRGDHLDIVGHYKREPQPQPASEAPFQPSRRYRTYDALKSKPRFTAVDFKKVWTEIFEFSTQAAPMTTAAGGGV